MAWQQHLEVDRRRWYISLLFMLPVSRIIALVSGVGYERIRCMRLTVFRMRIALRQSKIVNQAYDSRRRLGSLRYGAK
jgi:hypothetical protein